MPSGRPVFPHPDGLAAAKAAQDPGRCAFCEEPLPKGCRVGRAAGDPHEREAAPMIDATLIRAVADRAMSQIRDGVSAVRAGDVLLYELQFSLAQETLRRLAIMLEETPAKPMRRFVVVGTAAVPHDETIPEWFLTRHGDDPDGAA